MNIAIVLTVTLMMGGQTLTHNEKLTLDYVDDVGSFNYCFKYATIFVEGLYQENMLDKTFKIRQIKCTLVK